MKKLGGLFIFILVVAAVIVATGSLYVVDETQQVVITRFGEPIGEPITTPGLKLKFPFVDTVNRFEKRFLAWDGDRNQLPTKDKRFIYVDTYARWRITDPLKFFQRLRDVRGAQSRLDDILDGETRNTIARYHLIEVVRSTNREFKANDDLVESNDRVIEAITFGRGKLTEEVLATAQTRVGDLGIEILDFRFKRLNYVNEVRQEVYARMISERNRIAEKFRAEGAGEAARISGEKDKVL
ncbi:MAG: protease modulator HflC, partial [Acidobacteriota bacterium]|nr:protease modulator HflC [Acidobacteriota bacterium]